MQDIQLVIKFFLEEPCFEREQLDTLQEILKKHLPIWSGTLVVAKDEDSDEFERIGNDGNLFEAICRISPISRRTRECGLRGAYDGLTFFISHKQSTIPPLSNSYHIEIYGLSKIEKKEVREWVYEFFKDFTASFSVRYGNARLSEEFNAKNMIDDETGCRAIGVNLQYTIPGLYWLNYFGTPYVNLIQREKLVSAPAYEVFENSGGVMIALDETPLQWQEESYKARERQVVEHLGTQYFFDRNEPDRKTIAPDFDSLKK